MKKALITLGLSLCIMNPAKVIFASSSEKIENKIRYLESNGYINKTDNLRLNDNVTRAEFVKLLVIRDYNDSVNNKYKNMKSGFSDIKRDFWANGYINYIMSKDFAGGERLLNGYEDGTFKPNNYIKLSEMAKILSIYYSGFNNNDIEKLNKNWPKNWVDYANELGIVNILDKDSNDYVSRSMAFDAIYNVIDLKNSDKLSDCYINNKLNSKIDFKDNVVKVIDLEKYNLNDRNDFEEIYKELAEGVSCYNSKIRLINAGKYIKSEQDYDDFIDKYLDISGLDHITMYAVNRAISYKISYKDGCIEIMPEYMERLSDMQRAENIMNKWVKDNIKSTDRDIDKAIKIHDYIIDTFDYKDGVRKDVYEDGEYYGYDEKLNGLSVHSSTGLVLNGYGVCDAYAFTFQRLAKLSGLDSVVVTGNLKEVEGHLDHSWNKIKINGCWYNVDVVYNDPVYENEDMKILNDKYTCCLISDKKISKNHEAANKLYPESKVTYPRELIK